MSRKICGWSWAALAILIGGAMAAEPSEGQAESPKVTLTVVDSSYKYPPTTDFLTLHPDGSISGLGSPGGPVSDEKLAEWLRGGSEEKHPNKTYFRLMVAHEKEVSVDTLEKALQRIRTLADPAVEVVVFISLKEVATIEHGP